jgi:hypothetical protein
MSLCVRAAMAAGIALAGHMVSAPISFGILGVSSAEAAQFYTRKRVNGVWVEGRFPKAARSVRPVSVRTARKAQPARRVTAAPATPARAAAAPRAAVPRTELRREESSSTSSPVTTGSLPQPKPVAGLPDVEAALVIAAVGPVPPADETGLAAEERVVRLRRALEARADELKAKIELAPLASPAVAQPAVVQGAERSSRSEAPAATAPATGPVSKANSPSSAPDSAPALAAAATDKVAPLVPRSVSYNFETGIKTTVFENSVVREPFDRAAMRGLSAMR